MKAEAEKVVQQRPKLKIPNEVKEIFKDLPKQNDDNLQKTMIVIDGMNAAIRHGHNKRFSSKGLRIAIDFWISKKHIVLVLLPDFCFNKEDAIKRQASY